MRYLSTRGGDESCGFLHAVGRGRAVDGGLYLPQDWPRLTGEDIASAGRRSLAETAAYLLVRFAGQELDPELATAATREAATLFAHPAVAPLRELYANVWLLDLAQGPTRSAADFELQVTARLMDRALIGRGGSRTLLLATAGDDGPAAVEAFRDRAGIGLVVLYPLHGITPAQRLAMNDPKAGNVRAVEVDGGYDDCRALVAEVLAGQALVDELGLGSIGPENMARCVLQMAPLLAAAARLGAPSRPMAIASPAAELSTAFAAWGLERMGAPVQRILAAAETGDPLIEVMAGGRYACAARGPSASSIRSWPANFERLYFELGGRQPLETERAARALASLGAIDIPPMIGTGLRAMLTGGVADAGQVAGAIMAARNAAGETLDPATAAMVVLARRFTASASGAPVIVPRLAAPADPEATVGEPGERRHRLAADPDALRAYLRAFAGLSRAA